MFFKMRFFILATALILCSGCKPNYSSPRKDERLEKLLKASERSPVIVTTAEKVKLYSTGLTRNYSLIVNYRMKGYVLPQVFIDMNAYFEMIANSYKKKSYNKHIFFITVYDNEYLKALLEKEKYNLMPIIVHYSPENNFNFKFDNFDIRWTKLTVHSIIQFISTRTGVKIDLVSEYSLNGMVLMAVVTSGILLLLYFFGHLFLALNVRQFWAPVCTFFTIIMLSGFMFNSIQDAPLIGKNNEMSSLEFISQGNRTQYVSESIIVATIYIGLVLGLILINHKPFSKSKISFLSKIVNMGKQTFSHFILLGSFTCLVLVITSKIGGLNVF